VTEDLWTGAKSALERLPADPPGTEPLGLRARKLRTRRYTIAGLALVVISVGILLPVVLLSRLGTQQETDRVRPGSPIQTPPVSNESAAPIQTPPVTEEAGSPLPEPSAEPFPPTPSEPVTIVGSGTAFGERWTLSAYWSGHGEERTLCLRLTGAGEGCGGPTGAAPDPDTSFHAMYRSFSEGARLASKSFAYGVVSKSVMGVTAILDDGRVLSVETLRSKEFPVAFYVIPFKGRTQVAGYEALDAGGKVLDESTYRP
jgi:hypothetical protein